MSMKKKKNTRFNETHRLPLAAMSSFETDDIARYFVTVWQGRTQEKIGGGVEKIWTLWRSISENNYFEINHPFISNGDWIPTPCVRPCCLILAIALIVWLLAVRHIIIYFYNLLKLKRTVDRKFVYARKVRNSYLSLNTIF